MLSIREFRFAGPPIHLWLRLFAGPVHFLKCPVSKGKNDTSISTVHESEVNNVMPSLTLTTWSVFLLTAGGSSRESDSSSVVISTTPKFLQEYGERGLAFRAFFDTGSSESDSESDMDITSQCCEFELPFPDRRPRVWIGRLPARPWCSSRPERADAQVVEFSGIL